MSICLRFAFMEVVMGCVKVDFFFFFFLTKDPNILLIKDYEHKLLHHKS
jgi:hypothetical protein